MPDLDNRKRSRLWRELVVTWLQGQGLETAEARRSIRRRTSELLTSETPIEPDILNLPARWFVQTRSDLSPHFGTSLDAAEQSAHLAGFERAAVVQYRREHSAGDAIVTMSARSFAHVLRRDAADWNSLAEFEDWALDQTEREE